ncbi:MAG: hypothetical protein IJP89_01990 [Synergistaceae bacterium]|nr:hypothetical protein [Synergistaceae bacterium]MBR0258073.1 hypothetical protein [Synergistaceae bacterium]
MASDDISRIELLLREHFAQTDKQLSDMRQNIRELKLEVSAMKHDIERMKRDVGFIHGWDLWLIMAVITLLAIPKIVEGIKSLLGAVTETILAIMRIFRKA